MYQVTSKDCSRRAHVLTALTGGPTRQHPQCTPSAIHLAGRTAPGACAGPTPVPCCPRCRWPAGSRRERSPGTAPPSRDPTGRVSGWAGGRKVREKNGGISSNFPLPYMRTRCKASGRSRLPPRTWQVKMLRPVRMSHTRAMASMPPDAASAPSFCTRTAKPRWQLRVSSRQQFVTRCRCCRCSAIQQPQRH